MSGCVLHTSKNISFHSGYPRSRLPAALSGLRQKAGI